MLVVDAKDRKLITGVDKQQHCEVAVTQAMARGSVLDLQRVTERLQLRDVVGVDEDRGGQRSSLSGAASSDLDPPDACQKSSK